MDYAIDNRFKDSLNQSTFCIMEEANAYILWSKTIHILIHRVYVASMTTRGIYVLNGPHSKRWKGPGLGRGGHVRDSAACMVHFTYVIEGPIKGDSLL